MTMKAEETGAESMLDLDPFGTLGGLRIESD